MTMTTTEELATTKQLRFIRSLLGQIDNSQPDLNDEAMEMYAGISKRDASKTITDLIARRDRVAATQPKAEAAPAAKRPEEVPAGRYALAGERTDGEVEFYQVRYGKFGTRWDGFLFLDRLVGAPMDGRSIPVKDRATKAEILADIKLDVAEAAARFGRESEHCGFCAALLTDARSRQAGYGATCASNHGLPY